jgi:hypothetical protein
MAVAVERTVRIRHKCRARPVSPSRRRAERHREHLTDLVDQPPVLHERQRARITTFRRARGYVTGRRPARVSVRVLTTARNSSRPRRTTGITVEGGVCAGHGISAMRS